MSLTLGAVSLLVATCDTPVVAATDSATMDTAATDTTAPGDDARAADSTSDANVNADADADSAADASHEVVWNLVTDFGMRADDAKPAVDRAIAAARAFLAANPTRTLVLYFPAGQWVFQPASGPAIALDRLTGGKLTLRGAGPTATSLVFAQATSYGIFATETDGLTIEQLHLTRPGLYTTQGTVTRSAAGVIRFRVQPGFPEPLSLVNAPDALDNDRTLILFEGSATDPVLSPRSVSYKLCPGAGPRRCATAMRDLGGGEYEAILEATDLVADLMVGERVALKAKAGEQTLRAESVDDFTVRDVRFTRHAAVSLAVKGDSNRTRIERVRVERAPAIRGVVPFFSGPGGGPQIEALRDGPLIRGCYIEGTTDDALAVFSSSATMLMSGARIEGNEIRDGQGRGINITQSRDGVCVDNIIRRCQNPSIQIKSNQTAGGVGAVIGWTIARNQLVEPWTDPTIALLLENGVTGGRHDAITIENNVITRASRNNPVVYIENTASVVIRGNRIASFSPLCDAPGRGVPPTLHPIPLVYVDDAARVSGADNTSDEPTARPAWGAARSNMGAVDVQWSNTAAAVSLPPRCQ